MKKIIIASVISAVLAVLLWFVTIEIHELFALYFPLASGNRFQLIFYKILPTFVTSILFLCVGYLITVASRNKIYEILVFIFYFFLPCSILFVKGSSDDMILTVKALMPSVFIFFGRFVTKLKWSI